MDNNSPCVWFWVAFGPHPPTSPLEPQWAEVGSSPRGALPLYVVSLLTYYSGLAQSSPGWRFVRVRNKLVVEADGFSGDFSELSKVELTGR